ncbi:MAG: aminomethyl-transferring glycine dehydrogenase subunit GcvPA [Desulfobacterales bacterium]|nr:aminomethyl-transferring glycine dehydrogenase subunit GcvPA [Desulfobacterales bacterium]
MRYLPHTQEDIDAMLQVVGADSLDALFATIPESCCCRLAMDLPEPLNEWQLNDHMDRLAAQMATAPQYKVFLGAGSYDHFIPASLTYVRNRSEFVTSYTPYQPEISQGTLQAIYEYQTLASRLMGIDVTTASHYDGATALAEALLMTVRKTGRKRVAVSSLVHPHYRRVVKTYFDPTGYEVVELPYTKDGVTDLSAVDGLDDLAGVAIQSPNFFGCIEDLAAAAETAHNKGALFVAAFTEALAYGLLKSPGSLGADIVCGEGQSLGLARSFGGPGLGMLGSSKALVRSLPGRLVGKTTDLSGRPGFVLTLATREQHIRREKATSNICTNASLCALTAVMFMASVGGTGFRNLAQLNCDKAEYLKAGLARAGLDPAFDTPTFNEFVVRAPAGFDAVYQRLLEKKIVAGLPLAPYYPELSDRYLLCATETASRDDMDTLVQEVTS